ncbi:MAG: hypothetical protein U9Q78_02050 [Chloroflexota bacterium]|nr:hypothetical protein [Chloroflexota bacterium]
MAKALAEGTILTLLRRDDAGGNGHTAATIAAKLCGTPPNPLQAAEQRALAEAMIGSLLEQGKLQIAGYFYLKGGKVPRYKLANVSTPGGG